MKKQNVLNLIKYHVEKNENSFRNEAINIARYFDSIGKSMTNATAQKLLASGKVRLKGCKSKKTGNTFDATVYMEVSEDGKTSFNMEFDNGGKRK